MEGHLNSGIFHLCACKTIRTILFCLGFFMLIHNHILSQELVIKGIVMDRESMQPVNSVSVYDKTTLRGAITDRSGIFMISLPAGRHNLVFSFMGYEKVDTSISFIENSNISIFLNPQVFPVEEITITADAQKDQVSSLQMGTFTFSDEELAKLPSLLGETDVLKILQLTPGIQSATYGGVGFYVRGGGIDQNLILYDNTVLYNPGHLLGIFSVFNPDLVKDLSIVKSGIPAQYGGKLSSVIVVDSYKGNQDSIEVKGSLGLISSRVAASGPLFGKRGTFIVGARRTYLELIVKPIVKHAVSSTSFLVNDNSYNFYDLNLGASLQLSNKDLISLSGYNGRDNYRMDQANLKQGNYVDWGNSMVSLLWDHKFNQNDNWNTSISWTKYDFGLSGSQGEYSFDLFSSVADYNLKSELVLRRQRNKIVAGFELTEHSFVPNRISAQTGKFDLKFGQLSPMKALEGGLFVNNEFSVSERISVSGGVRLSAFDHHGPFSENVRNASGSIIDTVYYSGKESLAFFVNPEPRMVIKYQLSSKASIKVSYMRIAQYIHLATSASASLPADIWIPSSRDIKPLLGDQASIGYFRNFSKTGLEFSTELYYKKMMNQLEFLRGIVNISIEGNMESNMASGFGQAYGMEVYLAKKLGKTTGWLSYTLAKTELQFDEINEGYFYPAKYDRRHDVSFTISRTLNEKWSASAVFVYATGNAFTMPVGRYIIQGNVINQYGDVNSFRMPPNHRMDISLTRKITTGRIRNSEFVFSVYNLYNRANPYYIYYEIVGDVEKYSLKVKAFEVSLIPVIPSLSWNFKF